MYVIGLTGGVGSGKSEAARLMSEMFCARLLISDELGHIAMEPGRDSYHKIVERFGQEIVGEDGQIDRGKLADTIFGDDVARRDLNAIIHPEVIAYIWDYIDQRKQQEGIIILESAILFESDCDCFCDEIWYVYVSEQKRRQRLAESRGYSRDKTDAIMANQLSEEDFRDKCDVVLVNDGTLEELRKNIVAQGQRCGCIRASYLH